VHFADIATNDHSDDERSLGRRTGGSAGDPEVARATTEALMHDTVAPALRLTPNWMQLEEAREGLAKPST
jgi:hypothetical protein